jgi:mRNA-degrading endonuclease toxin of MazEF toxin-antitoxin module
LEGQVAKRRPVVVVSPPDRLKNEVLVLVVATSTTALSSEADRIVLPSLADERGTSTGLPKKCWVVPRWHLVTKKESLRDYIGYVPKKMQQSIVEAVIKRIRESI